MIGKSSSVLILVSQRSGQSYPSQKYDKNQEIRGSENEKVDSIRGKSVAGQILRVQWKLK